MQLKKTQNISTSEWTTSKLDRKNDINTSRKKGCMSKTRRQLEHCFPKYLSAYDVLPTFLTLLRSGKTTIKINTPYKQCVPNVPLQIMINAVIACSTQQEQE